MTSMRVRILGAASVAIIAAAACSDERAITTEPVGDVGYGQNLLKQATNLPRGRILWPNIPIASATPATDSLIVELAGLDSLSTGQYVVWVANDSATKFTRLSGSLTIFRTDTVINAKGDPVFSSSTAPVITNVSAFSNGRQNYIMRFATTRALTAGLAATDSAGLVIVSVETGTPGATPGERRFLWARRGVGTGTADTVTLNGQLRRQAGFRFGNFAPRVADEFVYASGTPARVSFPSVSFVTATTPIIPRGRIEVRGSVFTVNDSNYYRPPVGFYYEAFAIRIDTLGRFIDTVSLGHKASPYPRRIDFYEADKTIPDPISMYGLPTPVIVASQHRVSADTIPAAKVASPFGTLPWRGFGFVYVTLQNKAAPPDRMGGVAITTVGLPGSILGP
jgi:hypothetical protein